MEQEIGFDMDGYSRNRVNKRVSSRFDPKVQITKRRSTFNSTHEISEHVSNLSIPYFCPAVNSTKATGTSPMMENESEKWN